MCSKHFFFCSLSQNVSLLRSFHMAPDLIRDESNQVKYNCSGSPISRSTQGCLQLSSSFPLQLLGKWDRPLKPISYTALSDNLMIGVGKTRLIADQPSCNLRMKPHTIGSQHLSPHGSRVENTLIIHSALSIGGVGGQTEWAIIN